MRTTQSTNSLSLRNKEFHNHGSDLPDENSWESVNHPEDEKDIFDDEDKPEEEASAELRASKRRGYDPNSSIDENYLSFPSGAGSSVSSTPSLEKSIKKKKVRSDSPDSRDSDEPQETANPHQQVVYRKGQPTATSILIYEDTRREMVQQCIANLMSNFPVYTHREVIADSFTDRFQDMLGWLYRTDKAKRDTCKHWRAWSREKFVELLRLLYPQLSNAADKSYLEMIRYIPFQNDLENPVVKLKFQSELKIV